MNRNVNIFIEGNVRGESDDGIITKALGLYTKINEVHILSYKESAVNRDDKSDNIDKKSLGLEEDCLNTIKISPGLVEMIKSGENSTHMTFDMTRSTQSVYDTPYGSLHFQICTSRIDIEDNMAGKLILHMDYSLSHDDSHISDNQIYLVINEVD